MDEADYPSWDILAMTQSPNLLEASNLTIYTMN
jgi:hypothetical protein